MDQGEESGSNPLQLARVYRTAGELKLNRHIQSRILKSFYRMWCGEDDDVQPEAKSPASGTGLQNHLKSLVLQDAPWKEIRDVARQLLSQSPSEKLAAWYSELCYLNAGAEEATAAVSHYLTYYGIDFYYQIHPRIRERIALTYLSHGRQNRLGHLLMQSKSQEWFNTAEKGIFFLWLCGEKKDSLAFHFYQKYHKEIEKLSSLSRGEGGPGLGGIHLRAARLALNLGRVQEAVLLCRKISPEEPEYKEALLLLHHCGSRQELFRQSDLKKNLLACKGQEERLAVLRDAMLRVRQNGADLAGEFLTLNALLPGLQDWFDSGPSNLRALAYLFLENQDLDSLLPDYWQYFIRMILVKLNQDQALALWGPFGMLQNAGSDTLQVLKGVGLLQLVLRGELRELPEDEVFLARELLSGVDSRKSLRLRPGMPDLDQIWTVAMELVSSQGNLLPARRGALLKLVSAAKATRQMPLQDMEAYLDLPRSRPPGWVLNSYLRDAREHQAPGLELKVLQKMPERFSHYTNGELKRIWHICARLGDADLGWRALSILSCRTQLPVILDKHLLVSGERKKTWPCLKPSAQDFDSCLRGLSPEQAKFVWACLKVGHKMPSLLSKITSFVRPGRSIHIRKVLDKPDEAEKVLNQIRWLKSSPEYTVNAGQEDLLSDLPAFSERLPDNPWSHLVSKISSRMAVSSFRWRTSILKEALSGLSGGRQESWKLMGDQESQVSKWLRTLDHEQRSAWHDLSQLCHRVDDEAGFYALAVFICRLATAIYPDHYEALQSLRQMRAPVFLIWELEKWILGAEYTGIRKLKGIDHRVPIPASLKSDPVF